MVNQLKKMKNVKILIMIILTMIKGVMIIVMHLELINKKISASDLAKAKGNMLYVHQEKWQRDLLAKYGNKIFLMSATYKRTKYTVHLCFAFILSNSGYQIIGTIYFIV